METNFSVLVTFVWFTSYGGFLDKKANTHLKPDFIDFLADFYTEALAGTLINWAKNHLSLDKEKTISYLKQIIQISLSHFEQ